MSVINVYKPPGRTPLEVIDKLRKAQPDLVNEKMTYAGRLDPMAEGVLVVLSGKDRFNKPEYLSLDKVYTAEVCFGLETDTHDALGVVGRVKKIPGGIDIKNVFKQLEGTNLFRYPAFSSYKVQGKPLFEWVKEGKLDEIERPLKKMVINRIRVLDKKDIALSDIASDAITRVGNVDGDFRQSEIIDRWNNFSVEDEQTLPVYKIRVHCESGTYIRTLADEAGRLAGGSAFLLTLRRDRVGCFHSDDSVHL